MKPEAVFWALFFVLAAGLIVRAFKQGSRGGKRDAPETVLNASAEAEAKRAAPTLGTQELARAVATIDEGKPAPAAAAFVRPAQPEAPSPQADDVAPTVLQSVGVDPAPIPAPRELAVLAIPSVAATLDPAAIAKRETTIVAASAKAAPLRDTAAPAPLRVAPDVKATLPPVPLEGSGAPIVAPDVKATLPPLPAATAAAPTVVHEIEAPPAPVSFTTSDMTDPPEIRPSDLEPRAKHASSPDASRKEPTRRIAATPNVGNTFVSTKAATKIIGVPPKPLRVTLSSDR